MRVSLAGKSWLSKRRIEHGYTQQDLADRLKVCRSFVTQIENGKKKPSGEVAMKWSMLLGFDMSYFFAIDVSTGTILSEIK